MSGQMPRLRQFLESKLNEGNTKGFEWFRDSRSMFMVSWKHQANGEWQKENSEIFKQWAIHTRKYKNGDREEYTKWKTQFRCALNKASYIEKRDQLCDKHCSYKVFEFVSDTGTGAQQKRIRASKKEKTVAVQHGPEGWTRMMPDFEKLKNSDEVEDPLSIKKETMHSNEVSSSDDLPYITSLRLSNLELDVPLTVHETVPDNTVSSSTKTDQMMDCESDGTAWNNIEFIGPNGLLNFSTGGSIGNFYSPTDSAFNVKVFYCNEMVHETTNGDRLLYYGMDIQDVVPTLTPVRFPEPERFSSSLLKLLNRFNGGLILKRIGNCITAEHHTDNLILYTTCDASVKKLSRDNETTVFDFSEWRHHVTDPHMTAEMNFIIGQRAQAMEAKKIVFRINISMNVDSLAKFNSDDIMAINSSEDIQMISLIEAN